MGERTVMDTADVSALTQRIQELEKELGELSKTSESKLWETPQIDAVQTDNYPKQIVLTRANMLYVPLVNLSAKCVNVFKRIAAFI